MDAGSDGQQQHSTPQEEAAPAPSQQLQEVRSLREWRQRSRQRRQQHQHQHSHQQLPQQLQQGGPNGAAAAVYPTSLQGALRLSHHHQRQQQQEGGDGLEGLQADFEEIL